MTKDKLRKKNRQQITVEKKQAAGDRHTDKRRNTEHKKQIIEAYIQKKKKTRLPKKDNKR